jgi:hypothetical protein
MNALIKLQEKKDLLAGAWDELYKARAAVVKSFAKYDIGDKAICNGYSHNGKQIIISRMRFYDSYKGLGIMYYGKVIKKDGTAGVNVGEVLQIITKG